MKTKKITEKTKLNEVLNHNPKAAEILFEAGLYCVGCAAVSQETLGQGCIAHGMNKKQIAEILNKLNKPQK